MTLVEERKDAKLWEAIEEAVELLHEEQFHEALTELHRVLSDDPNNYYAFHYLGVAMYEVGELEGCRDALRACVGLAPKYLGALVALANVLRELGEVDAAVKVARQAQDVAPEDGDVLHAAGMAYMAAGDRVLAHRYLTAFLNTKPEFEVATEVQGVLDAMTKSTQSN